MSGVGTEKVFENDKVIVWNFTLAAGEETPLHTHDHAYMWYAIEGAPLQVFDEFGKDLGVFIFHFQEKMFFKSLYMLNGHFF